MRQDSTVSNPEIPCKQCPSLAMCLRRDTLNCTIILKYMVDLYNKCGFNNFQRESQPFCNLFRVYGFLFDVKEKAVFLSGRRLHG